MLNPNTMRLKYSGGPNLRARSARVGARKMRKKMVMVPAMSIANVGVRYILDRPAVAGVIVGARLGVAEHIADNSRVFGFALDDSDRAGIDAVLARSRDLMKVIGDCGDEYR